MTTPDNFRSLCSEILDLLDYHIPQDDRPTCWDPWRNRARALLSSTSNMGRPTLKEVSAWVDVVSSEAPRNHWSRRVDHHDAMAIALAVLHDAQRSDEQITPLTPSPGYERGDGSMDGAQMVDGEWWHPIMGCDSLSHVIDRANHLLVNKKQ